eukprot:TRINITY_DN6546_c0_g1_i1.p1 TRINITY_DN6546_c0_g1~~TRINITY_DN6546_c0_g1_i1.p1  ORF type:complete len:2021 (+),score=383.01 TRINITY_DN6546_c0_g1_i1:77-6064(+)
MRAGRAAALAAAAGLLRTAAAQLPAQSSCTEDSHCTPPELCVAATCSRGQCVQSPIPDGGLCSGGACLSGLCTAPDGSIVGGSGPAPPPRCASVDCSGKGRAEPTAAGQCRCVCGEAYAGARCEVCAAGYPGVYPDCAAAAGGTVCGADSDCPEAPVCQVGVCPPLTRRCTRQPRADGTVCPGGSCVAGACARWCRDSDCNSRGAASGVYPNCTCQCLPGYGGAGCGVCGRALANTSFWVDAGRVGVYPDCALTCTIGTDCAATPGRRCTQAAGRCDLTAGGGLCAEAALPDGTDCDGTVPGAAQCLGGRCVATPGGPCGEADCSFRGTASGSRPSCACSCALGYSGARCERCAPGWAGSYPHCHLCTVSTQCPRSAGQQCQAELGSCGPRGLCTYANAPDGSPCDDGSPLTAGDACVAGTCRGADGVYTSCPSGGLLRSGRCWYLSGVGQSCAAACAERALLFLHFVPPVADPITPRLLGRNLSAFGSARPFPWAALEALSRDRSAFHEALATGPGMGDPGRWSHGDYSLACPCNPVPCAVPCPAPQQSCVAASACDRPSGECRPGAALPDGTACGASGERCLSGSCAGPAAAPCSAPCPAPPACNEAGVCDPTTGECPLSPAADGSLCQGGVCSGGGCLFTGCAMWRQTGGCHMDGPRESHNDKPCSEPIPSGLSGWCECRRADGTLRQLKVNCGHVAASCNEMCGCGTGCAGESQCGGAARCDPLQGRCVSPPRPDGTPCDDGDPGTVLTRCVAGTCSARAGDVHGVIMSHGSLSTFASFIRRAEELAEVLRDPGARLTVLAPTNAAWAALPSGVVGLLRARPTLALPHLRNHVVQGAALPLSRLSPSTRLPSAAGSALQVTMVGAVVGVEGARIVEGDLSTANGVVHAIDGVLLLQPAPALPSADLLTVIAARPGLSVFARLMRDAGQGGLLSGAGPVTVFAPDDGAMQRAGLLQLDPANPAARRLLLHHAAAGYWAASDLLDSAPGELPSEAGLPLRYAKLGCCELLVEGGARVTGPDVAATNGVLHVIDTVVADGAVMPPAGPGGPAAADGVLAALERQGSARAFVSLLRQTGVAAELARPGPWTVFAPSDQAVERRLTAAAQDSLADHGRLEGLLRRHIVGGRGALLSQLPPALTGLDGGPLAVGRLPGGATTIGGAPVEASDITGADGVGHVVGDLVGWADYAAVAARPPTVLDVLRREPALSVFHSAVQGSGLGPALESPAATLTVVAPTDEAFAAAEAPLREVMADPELRSRLLRFHVLAGRRGAGDLLAPGQAAHWASTLDQDAMMPVAPAGPGATAVGGLGGAGVVVTDAGLGASNGVVHRIPSVLVPHWAAGAGLPRVPAPPPTPAPVPRADDGVSAAPLPGAGFACDPGTVCDLLQRRYQLGTWGAEFTHALYRHGLLEQLGVASGQKWTVFAPSQLAFDSLPSGTTALLRRRTSVERALLVNHIVPGSALSEALLPAASPLRTQHPTGVIVASGAPGAGARVLVNGAALGGQRDDSGVNGVLHSSTAVLAPPGLLPAADVVATAAASPLLSTFLSHLDWSGVAAELRAATGPLTVFAPTNAAFDAAPAERRWMLEDRAALQRIMRYHVVPGWITAGDIATLRPLVTLDGSEVWASAGSAARRAAAAQVAVQSWVVPGGADAFATNGVVHQVNELRFPPDLPFGATAAPVVDATATQTLTADGAAPPPTRDPGPSGAPAPATAAPAAPSAAPLPQGAPTGSPVFLPTGSPMPPGPTQGPGPSPTAPSAPPSRAPTPAPCIPGRGGPGCTQRPSLTPTITATTAPPRLAPVAVPPSGGAGGSATTGARWTAGGLRTFPPGGSSSGSSAAALGSSPSGSDPNYLLVALIMLGFIGVLACAALAFFGTRAGGSGAAPAREPPADPRRPSISPTRADPLIAASPAQADQQESTVMSTGLISPPERGLSLTNTVSGGLAGALLATQGPGGPKPSALPPEWSPASPDQTIGTGRGRGGLRTPARPTV